MALSPDGNELYVACEASHTVIVVDAIARRTVAEIEAEGGELVKAKGPILDITFFAVIKDTEGNLVGLWEDVKE